MNNLVIVAIPSKDDPVWYYSSEKVPHLTLLFLGDADKVDNQDKIAEFLEHAANTSLTRFGLDVDHRGMLGQDEADVLFFTKTGWDDSLQLTQFRDYLLQDNNIKKAYLDAQQFPEWQPHLTMGYPENPAKSPKNPFDRIYSVYFDRIALWTGNFEGIEFELKKYQYPEVAMSAVDDILAHHGIKGMKWGVRRANLPATDVVVNTKMRRTRQQVTTSGGERHPAHPDAVTAKTAAQKAKKSGIQALSNEELQSLAKRLNLEKQVSDLAKDQLASNGQKVVQALMDAQKVGK